MSGSLVQAVRLGIALVLAGSLSSCGRDQGADVKAALDRANRELLERVGWGVRRDGDLEWLTGLGRGDSHAWEIVVARSGVLNVQMAFGEGARAAVAVPVESGHHVYVVLRPRLGESGLVKHRGGEPGTSTPPGWTSWGVSSDRWGACISVVAPCDADQRIKVTTEGSDRAEWDWLDGQYVMWERPYFGRALGGTEVEGTPIGTLAIPAAARITGELLSAPAGDPNPPSAPGAERFHMGLAFPATPSASFLLTALTWSTRLAAGATPIEVGTWKVTARLRPAGRPEDANR